MGVFLLNVRGDTGLVRRWGRQGMAWATMTQVMVSARIAHDLTLVYDLTPHTPNTNKSTESSSRVGMWALDSQGHEGESATGVNSRRSSSCRTL